MTASLGRSGLTAVAASSIGPVKARGFKPASGVGSSLPVS